MVFFDDCNWSDHCAMVGSKWGVVCQRTPNGIQINEWEKALDAYALKKKDTHAQVC